MAVESSVSSDPGSTFLDSINVFDCRYLKCLFNIGLLNTKQKQSETRATRNDLQSGDKWQSKTLFQTILDLRSSMVLSFLIAAFVKCLLNIGLLNTLPNNTRNNLHFHVSVEKNVSIPDMRKSKTLDEQFMNAGQKSLQPVFSIASCPRSGE